MNSFFYWIYCLLTSGLFFLLLPVFGLFTALTRKHGEGFSQRLGFVPFHLRKQLTGQVRIWIHAASLGEVKAAVSIIGSLEKLAPECAVVLSTTTAHGHQLAQESFGRRVPVIYAPLDFIGSVKLALIRIKPRVMVFLETEIWPAWISEAKRLGSEVLLVNGRISSRSIRQYRRFRFFFQGVLKQMDFFSMISAEDARRIQALGARPGQIRINGNAKYDLLLSEASQEKETAIRDIYNTGHNKPVIIAGSTRGGEEDLLLHAFEKILVHYPQALLIIAPRHLNRVPEIEALIRRHGFRYQLRSSFDGLNQKREEQVVIVDRFGELFFLYSLGDINFCGASLMPLGGQNPLEAAIWGKAVFYGPYMEDFLDAKSLLDSVGAGIVVENEEMLAQKAIWYLDHPHILRETGERARKAVLMHRQAAERHARVIIDFIKGFKGS